MLLKLAFWYLAIAAVALVVWYPFGTVARQADKETEEILKDQGHH